MRLHEARRLAPELLADYHRDDWDCVLARVDEEGKIQGIVFVDGIEPEEAYLTRDLQVFVHELNWLAGENERLRGHIRELLAIMEKQRGKIPDDL